MKRISILFFTISMFVSAMGQTIVQKKIGQRHDDYIGNAWIGIDSAVFAYNAYANLEMQTNLVGNGSNGFDNQFRYTYTFNADNTVQSQLRESGSGTNWVNNSRYTYSYDGSKNLTQVLYEVWNSGNWNPSGKIVYSGYNSDGLYTQEIVYLWSGGTWTYMSKNDRTISSNHVQSSDKYLWNNTLQQWKKFERFYYNYNQDSVSILTHSKPNYLDNYVSDYRLLYNYNSSPFLKYEIVNQKYDTLTFSWFNDTRTSFVYTPSEKIDLVKNEIWSGAWNDDNRTKYIYDASDFLIENYTETNNGAWTNTSRTTYSYTGSNNTEKINYTGNGTAWNISEKVTLDYDANNNNIYQYIESYNGSSYSPHKRYYYYYNAITVGLNDIENIETTSVLYPNPTTGMLIIQFESDASKSMQIQVIDINGNLKMLTQQNVHSGTNQLTFNVEPLEAGNYFLALIDVQNGKRQIFSLQKK